MKTSVTGGSAASSSGSTHLARAGVFAVLVEAVMVGAYGIFLGVESMVETATEPMAAVFMALMTLLLAAALGWLARGLARYQRWALMPTLVWQMLQATVAVPALSKAPLVGVGLLVLCVVSAVGAVARIREARG